MQQMILLNKQFNKLEESHKEEFINTWTLSFYRKKNKAYSRKQLNERRLYL